jgi:acyl-CoA thioesterase
LPSLDDDTRIMPVGEGRWDAEVNGEWEVIRGLLGGYVAAILLRALTEVVGDPARPPRSFTTHFLRPPHPGPVTVRAEVVRAGRGMTTVSGRMEQDGRDVLVGLAAFAGAYGGPELAEAPMPAVEPPGPLVPPPPLRDDMRPPPFTRRLTMQRRFGDLPFSRSEHALVGGWIGLLEDRPLDPLAVVLLADAWFPAPFPRLAGPAAAPTIDLTVHFRAPVPPDARLLLGRFSSAQSRDGFFDEDGLLWAPDGTLVAQSRQLALLLGAET